MERWLGTQEIVSFISPPRRRRRHHLFQFRTCDLRWLWEASQLQTQRDARPPSKLIKPRRTAGDKMFHYSFFLKRQFESPPKKMTCSSLRLFRELPSFWRFWVRGDFCLFSNIMELDGTRLVVLKEAKNCICEALQRSLSWPA